MAEPDSAATVAVAYGTRERQRVVTLPWAAGLTARLALERSGLAEEFPEIGERELVLGIFGRPVAPDEPLRPGDRVEIGRPLDRDPREMRREAVAGGDVVGAGGKP